MNKQKFSFVVPVLQGNGFTGNLIIPGKKKGLKRHFWPNRLQFTFIFLTRWLIDRTKMLALAGKCCWMNLAELAAIFIYLFDIWQQLGEFINQFSSFRIRNIH